MAIIIGSARIDENGRAHGGKAGDQTGKEVSTQNYYYHTGGWRVFRPKSASDAKQIARAMKASCSNSHIGYDQYERNTLYNEASKYNFDPARVTKNVETDCSALIRVCCAYAGIMLGDFNTESEANVLLKSGKFTEITFTQATGKGLCTGDILVTKKKGHTAAVTSGAARTSTSTGAKKTTLTVTTNSSPLNLRLKPDTDSKVLTKIPKGTKITSFKKYNGSWYKVTYKGHTGYASAKFLS